MRIFTLGGEGSSSALVAGTQEIVECAEVLLFEGFQEARKELYALDDLLLVPSAYSKASDFFFDPRLDLRYVFEDDSIQYFLLKSTQKSCPCIYVHPATLKLVEYYIDIGLISEDIDVIEVLSTDYGAKKCINDGGYCIANQSFMDEKYLLCLSDGFYFKMTWNIFSTKNII